MSAGSPSLVQSLERILVMLDRREIDADALAGE
jgi:hypothetical protein